MKKNIIPDINLQNEIQKNKILNSRDFYKGKSFRFAHEWHDGITYFNDDFYTDFVVYKNVLLACKNTHTSNSLNVPVIIYDGVQPIGIENTEFWSFVLSGIVNPDASFKVQFSSSVESLPNASEHIGEIFVVGPVGNSGNAYEEYIAIHTPSYNEEYTWELIGGGNTSIDLSNYYTKEEINDRYQPRGHYLTRIPEEYVTDTELGERESAIIEHVDELISKQNDNISSKQDTLISGQNIKTINGRSILGEGNIEITAGSGDVDLTGYATEQWVENKGYLTKVPDGYITTKDLNDSIADWEAKDGNSFIKNKTHYKTLLGNTDTLVWSDFDYDSIIADNIPENTSHIYVNVFELYHSKFTLVQEGNIVSITSSGPNLNVLMSKNDNGTWKMICKSSNKYPYHFYMQYYNVVQLDNMYLPNSVITTENVNQITLDGGEIEFK